MKKYLTEFIGTFLLTLIIILSGTVMSPSNVSTIVLAGFTTAVFFYIAGNISGAHINPAVTIGVWSLRKLGLKDTLLYIIAQFTGALSATFFTTWYIYGKVWTIHGGAFTYGNNSLYLGITNFLGMLFFSMGVAAVVQGKVPSALAGFIIGGSLIVGLSTMASGSYTALNPAVALLTSIFSLTALIGQITGALAGMNLFKWLARDSQNNS